MNYVDPSGHCGSFMGGGGVLNAGECSGAGGLLVAAALITVAVVAATPAGQEVLGEAGEALGNVVTSSVAVPIPTPETHPKDFIKLPGSQGWRHKKTGETWKKDKLHKDHWDISDSKGNKVREVDFKGRQIWPGGPKNKNKGATTVAPGTNSINDSEETQTTEATAPSNGPTAPTGPNDPVDSPT